MTDREQEIKTVNNEEEPKANEEQAVEEDPTVSEEQAVVEEPTVSEETAEGEDQAAVEESTAVEETVEVEEPAESEEQAAQEEPKAGAEKKAVKENRKKQKARAKKQKSYKKDFLKQAGSFTAGRLFTLIVEDGLIFIFVTLMKFPEMPVKLGATFIVIVLNYIISKLYHFLCGYHVECAGFFIDIHSDIISRFEIAIIIISYDFAIC